MSENTHDEPAALEKKRRRIEELFEERYEQVLVRTDRLFLWLMLAQWAASILLALTLSPYAWSGLDREVHSHVYAALLLGGAITSLPVLLAWRQPGKPLTRYVIACAQMAWSALLIHLSGGRIETHFHIFGSLAILAFYRDMKIVIPATVVVAADHFFRGIYWPESVYGVANPEWWRFLEHAGWVLFIDVFIVLNALQSYRELHGQAEQQVEISILQEQKIGRMERLAAVGQLAASVGHELRNPLAAIRNAHTYVRRRLTKMQQEGVQLDPKVPTFLDLVDRELDASARIIGNLLDFSRSREPVLHPCPLRPLVEEAIQIVPKREDVTIANEVPEDLPVPELDKDQFRQVIVNLVQNSAEAMPAGRKGTVRIEASGGGDQPWRIVVGDDGQGIPEHLLEQIFQPLFSTKAKGTGLGLAVVLGMVERHGGTLQVDSKVGVGTKMIVELPAAMQAAAAAE